MEDCFGGDYSGGMDAGYDGGGFEYGMDNPDLYAEEDQIEMVVEQMQNYIKAQKKALRQRDKQFERMTAAQREAYEKDVAMLKRKESELMQKKQHLMMAQSKGRGNRRANRSVQIQGRQLQQQKYMRAQAEGMRRMQERQMRGAMAMQQYAANCQEQCFNQGFW